MRRPPVLTVLPVLLLVTLAALAGCSSDDDGGDGGSDGRTDDAWLETDVCALLPDAILEQVFDDPAAIAPEPRTPRDIEADVPDDVPDAMAKANRTECRWASDDAAGSVRLALFDPPLPGLFTETEGEDAITEPYDVDGDPAYVTVLGGGSCSLYLPTEPAWVTVDLSAYGTDPGTGEEPATCAIAADAAGSVADELGWSVEKG
ncbi:DUF3558 domain-containing protein [Nocardioides sp. 1609]|uniref:DUF3558 domain-containing protein n=1 Tax=Nocardioides sp. 1609 TaxID=2508327 RepID=UPI00106F9EAF|nr:DUF3558 domain-containing protein [Nocardioides sp. 1609]